MLKDFPSHILNILPGYFLWKDKESRYLGGNLATARLFGLDSVEALQGITDYDVDCIGRESAEHWVAQDQLVISSGRDLLSLEIQAYDFPVFKPLIIHKAPIYDSAGTMQGIQCYASDASSLVGGDSVSKLEEDWGGHLSRKPKSYFICTKIPVASLTLRESECLYYLMRGKVCREIAGILCRSSRTIEHHIENMKKKMGCHSKSALIEKSLESGLLQYLPRSVMRHMRKFR